MRFKTNFLFSSGSVEISSNRLSACLSSSILVLISNGVTHTALLFICDVLLVFACSVVDVKFSRRDRTARHDSYKDIIS